MSTPYVGIKRMMQRGRFVAAQPWVPSGFPTLPSQEPRRNPELPQPETPVLAVASPNDHQLARQRLIEVLRTHCHVTGIQVGALQMQLSEAVPDKHLLKAAHYLLTQYQAETQPPSVTMDLLEAALIALARHVVTSAET